MTTYNDVKAYFLYKQKRKASAHLRQDGDPDTVMLGDWKKKTFPCRKCGSWMEYWREDKMGDWIYSCTNEECVKSKDYGKKITIEMKKQIKMEQMNNRLYYRNYMGGYH